MNFNNIGKMRKMIITIVCVIICCVILILFIINKYIVKPISIEREGVDKITIAINISSKEKTFTGNANISDDTDLTAVVEVLNNIKASKGNYSIYDLEGDSPSATVMIYNGKEKMNSIYFYYNILVYNEHYYKISISEYDKLIEVCKNYSE